MSRFVQKNDQFEINFNSQSKRLLDIKLSKKVVENFLKRIKDEGINVQHLEYTPYERQVIASYLDDEIGANYEFGNMLRNIVNDRETGGFTIGLEGVSKDTGACNIFCVSRFATNNQ